MKQKKSAKMRKSVMSRLQPLTNGQRVDEAQLIAAGIPAAEARAIAQGYEVVSKADTSSQASDQYYRSYHAAAKAYLPDWQHKVVHQSARGRAGAFGRTRARQKADVQKRTMIAELEALKKRMREVESDISKSSPLASEVHVPTPLKGGRKKALIIGNVQKSDPLPIDAAELAYIKAAYGLQDPTESYVPDAQTVPPEIEGLMQANRLVAGMDQEFASGAPDAEAARRRASRSLLERPGIYDGVGSPPEVRAMRGLMLDIGSGPARERGYLGVDLYAFDYGTVLHDVDLGLPFPDSCVRAIRLVNSLHPILDAVGGKGDPTDLLTECQRVMMEGGRLYYEGPEPLFEEGQRWPLPGLILTHQDDSAAVSDDPEAGTPVRQTFERVPLRVPAYHGADALFAPAGDLPVDMQMAMAAYNTAPAEAAMANLVHKNARKILKSERVIPIIKAATHKQIVYGVVLAPHEVDTQGDFMTPEDIEKAAHYFITQSRVIGSEHGRPIEAGVVESYIAPADMQFNGPLGPCEIAKGSWVLGVKINDADEWAKVLNGDYTGFSVGGFGSREDLGQAA